MLRLLEPISSIAPFPRGPCSVLGRPHRAPFIVHDCNYKRYYKGYYKGSTTAFGFKVPCAQMVDTLALKYLSI